MGARAGRLRIRLHAARPHRSQHRVGLVLRQRSHPLGRAQQLARSVSPWLHTLDSPPNQVKYRCHWTAPLAIDPFDHNTVYYGCQMIFAPPTAA